MSEYTAVVTAGIKFLDGLKGNPCSCSQGANCSLSEKGKVPADWRSKINLDKLDMGNVNNCIIGQLFGDYFKGLNELGVNDYRTSGEKSAYDYGFIGDSNYELGQEWKRVLKGATTPVTPAKPTRVELYQVYVDGSYGVKPIDYVWVDPKGDGSSVKLYIIQFGRITGGVFEPHSTETSNLGMKSQDEILSEYGTLHVAFKVKEGMFVTDDKGMNYFIKGDYAYPVKEGARKVLHETLTGLRELTYLNGQTFSSLVK